MLRYRIAGPLLVGLRILRAFRRETGEGFRIVIFHDVPAAWLGLLDRLVARLVAAPGLIAPAEAEAWLTGTGTLPAPKGARLPCLLSFDDGFASNLRAATEVLGRHRAKALFFVCPGLVDLAPAEQRAALAQTIFDGRLAAEDLPAGLRLMDRDEIAALAGAGHTLGAHGMRHRRLAQLAGAELEREIVEAGDRLAERLGKAVDWFAFPFGDAGSVSADALRVVGRRFRFCRSGVRGVNRAGTRPLALRADPIDLAAPDAWQAFALEGGLDSRYAEARRRLDEMAAAAGAEP